MRNGQAWPNSGGSEIEGNSGERVCVRSITRIFPATNSFTNEVRAVMPTTPFPALLGYPATVLTTLGPRLRDTRPPLRLAVQWLLLLPIGRKKSLEEAAFDSIRHRSGPERRSPPARLRDASRRE